MLPPHLLRLLLHHHHPPSSTLLPFLAQPLQLSVSFTPKETRSCQKEAALKELQFHNQRLFFVFYTTGKCVCVCVVWEKARWASSFSSVPTPPPSVSVRKCHFHRVNVLSIAGNFIEFVQFFWRNVIIQSYCLPPHPKKKQLKLKKRKLWVTLIEMLMCNYFCICHFWRCKLLINTKKLSLELS